MSSPAPLPLLNVPSTGDCDDQLEQIELEKARSNFAGRPSLSCPLLPSLLPFVLWSLVASARRRVVEGILRDGYPVDMEQCNERNRVYHALTAVEGHLIRSLLRELRRDRPPFSHAYIYDAILVHNDVSSSDVTQAFDRVTAELGLHGMRICAKSWVPAET